MNESAIPEFQPSPSDSQGLLSELSQLNSVDPGWDPDVPVPDLDPPEEAGELFGFKAVAGRFSAVLGPLTFGWVSVTTGSQRIALGTIGVFFLVGLVLLRGFREEDARAGFAD